MPTSRQLDLAEALRVGPRPRLCHLTKWSTTAHPYPYGFFLRQESSPTIRRGVFTSSVRRYPPSPAYLAGLRSHDRIIEVNFISVENASFTEIDRLIGQFTDHVTLLVACPMTVRYYGKLDMAINHRMANILAFKAPDVEPIIEVNFNGTPQLETSKVWRPNPCSPELILQYAPINQQLPQFNRSLDAIQVFLETQDQEQTLKELDTEAELDPSFHYVIDTSLALEMMKSEAPIRAVNFRSIFQSLPSHSLLRKTVRSVSSTLLGSKEEVASPSKESKSCTTYLDLMKPDKRGREMGKSYAPVMSCVIA